MTFATVMSPNEAICGEDCPAGWSSATGDVVLYYFFFILIIFIVFIIPFITLFGRCLWRQASWKCLTSCSPWCVLHMTGNNMAHNNNNEK